MCDPKDTLVLPCRHLCMCSGCADVLRMQGRDAQGATSSRDRPKCPICRQVFHSLVKVNLPPPYSLREDSVKVSNRRSIVKSFRGSATSVAPLPPNTTN
jgi:transcriptional regulator NrdR family protein